MAALTANYSRPHLLVPNVEIQTPVKAEAIIFYGALVCVDATGMAVPGSDTAGLIKWGICWPARFPEDPDADQAAALDNTGGTDGVIAADGRGTRSVPVLRGGIWLFATSGATPVAGQRALIVDDNTLTAAAGGVTNDIEVGQFVRPGAGGWYVDLDR